MVADRFKLSHIWRDATPNKAARADQEGYDFHAACLEMMDVIWAWALAAGVLLLLSFTL